jgi:copper chaperone CopZ
MNRILKAVPTFVFAISLASIAWAGGTACTAGSAASAEKTSAGKTCPYLEKAEKASAGDHCAVSHKAEAAGDHCPMMKGAQEASAGHCGVKANQAMYSFAVPGAECGHCSSSIQKAAMEVHGVSCAHVDLNQRVAYVIVDKGMDRQRVAKAIQAAGFKCTFKAQGAQVEAAFAKTMATAKGSDFCCSRKDKEKA